MTDTSVTKVESAHAPKGPQGQRYLASGRSLSMRLWDKEPPGGDNPPSRREYETVGYVVSGRATLNLEGQSVTLSRQPFAQSADKAPAFRAPTWRIGRNRPTPRRR